MVSLSACGILTRTGKLREETQVVDLQGAESATVHVRMGAGELAISEGSAELMDATFLYNVPDWQPTLDYVVSGGEGELWVEQPEVNNVKFNSYRYEWDLRFNQEVPLDLQVALGAGESQIDLSQLTLTDLKIEMGVGDLELDLTGARDRDLDVVLRGGIGQATLLLPADVGVKAAVTGGIGEIETSGLSKDGSTYVNEAYGQSDTTLTLDVEAGIGEIELRVEE
jgi:hypothetical protein